MRALDKKSDKVYNWIRAYIDQNKFSANLKIPSENVISMRLEVSRETVRHALERLAAEGLVTRVKGSGTYINKAAALSREPGRQTASLKIGLILQGQDSNANSLLIGGDTECAC